MLAACTSTPSPQVRELGVSHPKEGAVYWEGPVEVDLAVSLTGEMRVRPLPLDPLVTAAAPVPADVIPVVVLATSLIACGRI